MKLAFIGYGALGAQIISLLQTLKTPISDIVYFDDILFKEKEGLNNYYDFEDFRTYDLSNYKVFIGLGYKHLVKKREIINELLEKEIELLTFIHPTSYVSPLAKVEAGVIIYPMCNIDSMVTIKMGAILHNSVVVSHETTIGMSAYIAPGVIISGNVTIGNSCFLGAGCVISNGITLGDKVTIGIGSVVSKNIDSSLFAIGNPAIIKKNLNLK